jgi:hypothetical protein
MTKMLLRAVAVGALVAGVSSPLAAAPIRPLGDGAAQQDSSIQPVYWDHWHHWHHWHHPYWHHRHYWHRHWWHHHWHYY